MEPRRGPRLGLRSTSSDGSSNPLNDDVRLLVLLNRLLPLALAVAKLELSSNSPDEGIDLPSRELEGVWPRAGAFMRAGSSGGSPGLGEGGWGEGERDEVNSRREGGGGGAFLWAKAAEAEDRVACTVSSSCPFESPWSFEPVE